MGRDDDGPDRGGAQLLPDFGRKRADDPVVLDDKPAARAEHEAGHRVRALMQDPWTAHAYLARAESRIGEMRDRITWQADLAGRLQAAGEDGQRAATRLAQFRQDLECWQEHRDELARGLAADEGPGQRCR